jgi:hypothetical protein
MPIYLDNPEEPPARTLFGDPISSRGDRKLRGRQQVVWCEKCNRLDSVFLGGGVSLSAKRCAGCSGELVTSRAKSAKLKFYDAIMDRCLALTVAAARGKVDVDQAASYAEYAAHTAFNLRLARYGPEPKR